MARFASTRVSLARFNLASFILTRYQFGEFLFGALPVRRVSLFVFIFCEGQFGTRSIAGCAHVSFLRVFSAKKCCLRQFAAKPLY